MVHQSATLPVADEAGQAPEYRVVDARIGRDGVSFFALDELGRCRQVEPGAQGRCGSRVLPGLWFLAEWFPRDPLPNLLEALDLILASMRAADPARNGAEDGQRR